MRTTESSIRFAISRLCINIASAMPRKPFRARSRLVTCGSSEILPLVMTNGGPVDASMTPNLYIFDQFRDPTPFARSFSLTASLVLFVVLGTITALIFRLVRSDKAVDG